jgi:hypothetical protein
LEEGNMLPLASTEAAAMLHFLVRFCGIDYEKAVSQSETRNVVPRSWLVRGEVESEEMRGALILTRTPIKQKLLLLWVRNIFY